MRTKHRWWFGSLLLSPLVVAQVQEACKSGDGVCYSQRYQASCTGATATAQSCASLVEAVADSAAGGDREALIAQARAYSAIGARLATSPSEQALSRERAQAIYRSLVASDPRDADALMGLVAKSESTSERLELLRRVVALRPTNVLAVSRLVDELRNTGQQQHLVEGAKLLADLYRTNISLRKWELAADAIDLYQQAGAVDLLRELRAEVRADFAASDVVATFTRAVDADPEAAFNALETICHGGVLRAIDAVPCIGGIELFASTVTERPDRRQFQAVIDRVAILMQQLGGDSATSLSAASPRWRDQFLANYQRMAERNESATVWHSRAMIEFGNTRVALALEQALRLDPMNARIMLDLADVYAQQGRWEEAILISRQAKEFSNSVNTRRIIDHNVATAEEMRDAQRETPQR